MPAGTFPGAEPLSRPLHSPRPDRAASDGARQRRADAGRKDQAAEEAAFPAGPGEDPGGKAPPDGKEGPPVKDRSGKWIEKDDPVDTCNFLKCCFFNFHSL